MTRLYKNQATTQNNVDLFNTYCGALNKSPLKISGNYKIVITSLNELFLDDYTGRRVRLDITEKFLPQVANFLSISTTIVDYNKTNYGGFQEGTTKSYHIPLYFAKSSKLPTHFVVSKIQNNHINNLDDVYATGNIIRLCSFEKIGLSKIFNEIETNQHFDYPMYFNFEDDYILANGYSINNNSIGYKQISLKYNRANQTNFDVLNNKILNTFNDNGLFYPRFLNIEIEFDYINTTQNQKDFQNFYGFLSIENIISAKDEISPSYVCKIQEYQDKSFKYEQIPLTSVSGVQLNEYTDIFSTVSIQKLSLKEPQIAFRIQRININDTITIYSDSNTKEFEYRVTSLESTLYQTLLNICNEANRLNGNRFRFSVIENQTFCDVKIIFKDVMLFTDDARIEIPIYYTILDRLTDENKYNFRGIAHNDIWLQGDASITRQNITTLNIDNIIYTILETFKFNSKLILRLNNQIPDDTKYGNLYMTKTEKLVKFEPIDFLHYIESENVLFSDIQYDQLPYINELRNKFVGDDMSDASAEIANQAINIYSKRNIEATQQYVAWDNVLSELIPSTIIETDSNVNNNKVLNMMFSSGITSYLTPNILNIDNRFYKQNGNLDPDLLVNDTNRYSWFLIKSECPQYLANDVRSLRYFTDYPKISSKINKVNNLVAETFFLGVKYQLPVKYDGYLFSVYLEPNNISNVTTDYSFDIDILNKRLSLKISKYLDFVDLLRGANEQNPPFIDLSFFHSVIKSLNSQSSDISAFKIGGLYIAPDMGGRQLLYDLEVLAPNQWIKYDENDGEYYIAILRETELINNAITDMQTIVPESGNLRLEIYSETNDISYISIIIDIIGIKFAYTDYVWCKDIVYTFFDSPEIYVRDGENFLLTDRTDITIIGNESNNVFGDNIKEVSIIGRTGTYKLLLPDKQFSFKENYFELKQTVNNTQAGANVGSKSVFYFPEFFLSHLTDENIFSTFSEQFNVDDFSILNAKKTLFDKNQIWMFLRDLTRIDIRFKQLYQAQVRRLINELAILPLIEYTKIDSIKINNSQDFIKINIPDISRNMVIWNLNNHIITNINRPSGAYFPFLPLVANKNSFQNLKTIYDTNVSATGFWKEITGNILSSLFCKHDDIIVTIDENVSSINILSSIVSNINIDTITISELNKNYSEFILFEYSKVLSLYYYLDSIMTINNKKIDYMITGTGILSTIEIDRNSNIGQLKLTYKRK